MSEQWQSHQELRARMPLSRRSAPAEPPLDARSIAALQARIAELEARLANIAAELERARTEAERERGERLDERTRADRLANEVAEIARKLAAIAERTPPQSRPSVPTVIVTQHRSW